MDIGGTIETIVSWLVRVISGLGIFLPIAIFAIFNLISGSRKKQQQQPAPDRRQPVPGRQTAPSAPQPRPQQPSPEAMPFPIDLSPWFGNAPEPSAPREAASRPRQPDAYRQDREVRRDDAYRHDDDTLRWGSAFTANDAERAESGLRWGSIFDEDGEGSNWRWEKTKWGWDDAEWGGGFARKRHSEPIITIG